MINISQDSFYNLNVNQDIDSNDIITYYLNVCGCVGVTLSFIFFILKMNNIVDEYFERCKEDVMNGEDEENEEEIPYEMKWFQEYDEMDNEDEDVEDEHDHNEDDEGLEGEEDDKKTKGELTEDFVNTLSLKTITETTPRGDVLMYYSSKLNSFVYHSKTKEIPYKYLETVARKYVIEYKCKKLYIDIRKEYEKGLNKYKQIKEKEENGMNSENNDTNKKKKIFANLKTYNRKGEVNNKQKDKIYILKEQANRYSYRGKIEEYNEKNVETCLNNEEILKLTNEKGDNIENENKVKDIDFASFKKYYMK
jgi:hypothetical protein